MRGLTPSVPLPNVSDVCSRRAAAGGALGREHCVDDSTAVAERADASDIAGRALGYLDQVGELRRKSRRGVLQSRAHVLVDHTQLSVGRRLAGS
eukprot:scaffold161274_cov50-Tisochrysis_lutea.AAC.1